MRCLLVNARYIDYFMVGEHVSMYDFYSQVLKHHKQNNE